MELKPFTPDQTADAMNPLALPAEMTQRRVQIEAEAAELRRLVMMSRGTIYADLSNHSHQPHAHDPAHALLGSLLARARFLWGDLRLDPAAKQSLNAVDTLSQFQQVNRMALDLAIEKIQDELPEPEIVEGDPLPHPHHHHGEKLVE